MATLSADGKKWSVEKVTGGDPIFIKEVKVNQTVYMFKCKDATIVVEGKIAAAAIDECEKCQVVLQDVVGSVEVTNSKRVKFQISGSCPNASIDKTDGCTVYLMSDEAKKMRLSTAKHSDVQLSYMKDDEMVEVPIPEQFVHELQENGKVSSTVSDLYG